MQLISGLIKLTHKKLHRSSLYARLIARHPTSCAEEAACNAKMGVRSLFLFVFVFKEAMVGEPGSSIGIIVQFHTN